MLVATLDGVGAARLFSYDGLNQLYSVAYSGEGGVTTPVQYAYDFDGRLSDAWNYYTGVASAPSQNRMSYTYSADGMLAQKTSDQLGTIIAYSYYPDATLAGVSATTTRTTWGDTVNQPNLYRYAYRNDGLLTNESFGVTNQSVSWSYTRDGRMTSMTDFGGSSPSIAAQYADGHGRLSSYTTPSGTYGNFVYDSQGRTTQYTDPYTSIDGEIVSSTYNIRGDLVGRNFSGGAAASKPGFQYKNIQGVLVQNATDQYDGRTGATLVTYDWGAFSYDQVGRLTRGGAILSYDAENRLASGDTFNASTAADDDCHSGGSLAPGLPLPKELTYLYDAGGRLFQDQTPGAMILGHQRPNNVRQWLWDGSTPLYTMSMSANRFGLGALLGYAADGLGSITADGSAPGLTISDRDLDGTIAQYHNNTGHSTWAASNVYNQFCQHGNPLPASSNYVGTNSSSVPDDGSSDGSLTVSSMGRAYLSRSMGYTTPDYSSATPYASGQRGIRAECKNPTVAKQEKLSQIGCSANRPYLLPSCQASTDLCGQLVGPYDPFGTRVHRPSNDGGDAGPRVTKRIICFSTAKFYAVAVGQAPDVGALYSRYPNEPGVGGSIKGGTNGTVAVKIGFLGLSKPQLRTYGTQIFVTPADQAIIAKFGGPTGPLSVSDYGDKYIQANKLAFDIYRFPSVEAANGFGKPTMGVTISFPAASGGLCP